jgi:hypothetical protein
VRKDPMTNQKRVVISEKGVGHQILKELRKFIKEFKANIDD